MYLIGLTDRHRYKSLYMPLYMNRGNLNLLSYDYSDFVFISQHLMLNVEKYTATENGKLCHVSKKVFILND